MSVAFLLHSKQQPMDAAIMMFLAHHCYLRPGELFRCKWRYLTRNASPSTQRMALTLHPAELQKPSKTGEFDETVVIDLPWLINVLDRVRKSRDGDSPLVPVAPRAMAALFDEALVVLGIPEVLGRETMYVLRHSGPSADAWHERRSIE